MDIGAALGLRSAPGRGRGQSVEFNEAKLRVEVTATDGDAGLQIDLDHELWQWTRLETPDGRVILDVRNRGVLKTIASRSSSPSRASPPGACKAEVLAIEKSGNQTLTEIAFSIE